MHQAQHNIQRALRLFEQKKPGMIPQYYTDSVECIRGVLCGHKDVTWGLLSTIREIYPQTEPRNQPYLHLTNTGLPYSVAQLRKLEISLLNWLKALGLIGDKTMNSAGKVVTILELEREIRNGTLLCDLAQIISGKHLPGVFRSPKTDATALANLSKALECFRALPRLTHKYFSHSSINPYNVNRRYLWSEKELFNGDRGTILGLLEVLHRYYDGVTVEMPATPYLGKYV